MMFRDIKITKKIMSIFILLASIFFLLSYNSYADSITYGSLSPPDENGELMNATSEPRSSPTLTIGEEKVEESNQKSIHVDNSMLNENVNIFGVGHISGKRELEPVDGNIPREIYINTQYRDERGTRNYSYENLNVEKTNDVNEKRDGSFENPFVTFKKAKEYATENKNIETIYVLNSINILNSNIKNEKYSMDLSNTNAKLKRYKNFDGYLLNIENSYAVLSNITIDGNSEESANVTKPLIYVTGKSTLDILDGTVITNNHNVKDNQSSKSGGGIEVFDSTLNMSGGEISNNKATWGAGVRVNSAKFNMSGGVIKNNEAVTKFSGNVMKDAAAGGGIGQWSGGKGSSKVTISNDAKIINNKSQWAGGGISVGTSIGSNFKDYLEMKGGLIEGNEAYESGGGVFVQAGVYYNNDKVDRSAEAHISGGKIINNKIIGDPDFGNVARFGEFGGAAIYVNGLNFPGYTTNGTLYLKNAVITDNRSAKEGAGLASCPCSDVKWYPLNGAYIYGNTMGKDKPSDFYLLQSDKIFPEYHKGKPNYALPVVTPGETADIWRTVDDGELLSLNNVEGKLKFGSLHLYSDLDDLTKEKARNLDNYVLISGNTSVSRGAAIGSNGNVVIGEGPKEKTKINIKKYWNVDKDSVKPDSIVVNIYGSLKNNKEKKLIAKQIVSSENEWTLDVNNLPKYDFTGEEYIYSIEEEKIKGYGALIENEKRDNNIIPNSFIITNSKERLIELVVNKIWEVSKPTEKKPIRIQLLRDGEKIGEEVELNEGNNWKYIYKDLLKFKNDGKGYTYSIKEVGEKNKKIMIEGIGFDVEYTDCEGSLTVKNKLVNNPIVPENKVVSKKNVKPVEPVEPVEPIEPVKPVKPVEPVEPVEPIEPVKPINKESFINITKNKIEKNITKKNKTCKMVNNIHVKTSDDTNYKIYIILIVFSSLYIIIKYTISKMKG